ncbi:MAG: hypothetical protein JXR22_01035 [Prolixibacteraceae bacterium]|nr:hypothetical protein [Prolixibacteraceae bacterium]
MKYNLLVHLKSILSMRNSSFYLHALIALIFVLIFSDCNKDDYEPALFSIRVTEDVSYSQKKDMIVSFVCNGSIIPEVKINGYYLEKFSNTSLIISANVMIPYSDTIHFSVSASGHSTSGFLMTPQKIERVLQY